MKGNIPKHLVNVATDVDSYEYYSYNNSISWSSLERIFIKHAIPFEYYNLNGYQEEALCLELHSFNWFVYYAERGRRYEEMKFSDIDSACIEIIKRISLNETQEKEMIEQYNNSKVYLSKIGVSLSIESEVILITKKIRNKILSGESTENCINSRIFHNDFKSVIERRDRLLEIVKNEDMEIYNNLYKLLDLENEKSISGDILKFNKMINFSLDSANIFLSCENACLNCYCDTLHPKVAFDNTITKEDWMNLENYFMMRQQEFPIGDRKYEICNNLLAYSQRRDASNIKRYLQTIGKEAVKTIFAANTNIAAMETVSPIVQKILSSKE